MNHYDVIIIGAGLGGLTAGALLAMSKKKILILEQHTIVGGCATTFKRKDLTVEVGLHEMDGLDSLDLKLPLFKKLGILDKIETVPVPEFYRVVRGNELDVTVPDNLEDARSHLCKLFPEEKKGIETYFRVLSNYRREIHRLPRNPWKFLLQLPLFPFRFPTLIKQNGNTLGRFLDEIIQNEDLKLVLSANLGYYHDDPYTMSMDFYSVAQASYFQGGGHFIKYGSGRLSDALADVIRKNGGEVRTGRLAKRILMEGGRTSGVEHTPARSEEKETDFAPVVIANAALPENLKGMLSEKGQTKIAPSIENKEIACSIFTIYMGIEGDVKNDGAYSTFFLHPELKKLKEWSLFARGPLDRRGFVFVDYSKIDSGLAPEGKSLGVICATDYWNDWAPRNTEEYAEQKKRAEEIMMRRLDEHFPGITGKTFYRETGTARTIERYTKNTKGSVYGFAQIPGQTGIKRIGNRSPIPGLYYASAWTMPGGGFTGAILSGLFAAQAIDPKIKI